MNLFYFDTETTGLDPNKNDIWQLSFITVNDSKTFSPITYYMKPKSFDSISQQALSVGNITIPELKRYPSQYSQLLSLKKHLANKKYVPVGYNIIHFDVPFLRSLFFKNGMKSSFYYHFSFYCIDLYPLVQILFSYGFLPGIPDLKLEHVCNYFSIPIKAHDATEDIIATRELAKIILPSMIKHFNSNINLFPQLRDYSRIHQKVQI